MRPWTVVYLLFLLVYVCQGQITLSVQPNVTSNVSVCSNSMVVFTCDARAVGVLFWRFNGTQVPAFTSSSPVNDTRTDGQFRALLISNQQIQGSAARNYLSTLTVPSVSDLDVGSVVGCLDDSPSLQSINVNYTLIRPPPTPLITVSVTRSQDGSASITLIFDAAEYVDMYSIDVSGDQGVNCPQLCSPSGTCVCTGLAPGDGVMVNLSVSAVNCETQVGPAYEVSFTPRVPGVPSSCWIVPVYSAIMNGPLTRVVAVWNNVSNPLYLTNTLSQNVLSYSVTVGGEMIQVPVDTACLTNRTCSTDLGSYYNQNSNTSFDVSVAATNLFGNGPTQTCDVPSNRTIESVNTIFAVNVMEDNRRVQCIPGEQGSSMGLSCEFCYGRDTCDNPTLTCINTTTTNSLSGIEEEGTYCFRATAFIDGDPVAVIQGNFVYQGFSVEDLEGLFVACLIFIVVSAIQLVAVIAEIIYCIIKKLKNCHIAWWILVGVTLTLTLILPIILISVSRGSSSSNSRSLAAAALFFSLVSLILNTIVVIIIILVIVLDLRKHRGKHTLSAVGNTSDIEPSKTSAEQKEDDSYDENTHEQVPQEI